MTTVAVVGVGDLGSRHLQALRAVKTPLTIHVIDPSHASLERAKQRYTEVDDGSGLHTVTYADSIASTAAPFDVVIVATTSMVRRLVIEQLLQVWSVRHLVLEKVLFPHLEDYDHVQALLDRHGVQAWVNCCRRTMPGYANVRGEFGGQPIEYHVTGSHLGLGSSAIHHLDYVGYLTGCHECDVDTSALHPTLLLSKRDGFREMTGTLRAQFADGSEATMTSYASGDAPIVASMQSAAVRVIVRESEEKAWVARAREAWAWHEVDAPMPRQSQMTTGVVESILARGECALTPYGESVRYHQALIRSALRFFSQDADPRYSYCPLT